MRVFAAASISALCLAVLVSCSKPQPPTGRWQGTYDSSDTLVDARLEITSKGLIYVSAPDAENVTPSERATLKHVLAQQLSAQWRAVQPRTMDFDGTIFRKPGGIAPQMEWDSASNRMTLIVYLGKRPSIRIPLHPVADFNRDPWGD